MKNLNLLFNKSYFNGIEKASFKDGLKERNDEICGVLFRQVDFWELDGKVCPKNQRFLMKTTYPGLLTGVGYAHEAEAGSDNCVKLGFSFDYTTGQPYVPGSSVKGMLRSCFQQPDVIGEVLSEIEMKQNDLNIDIDSFKQNLDANVRTLETSIFDGGDTFFDAALRCGNWHGKVMGLDYVTPHKGETKNPIPILMAKVLPEVIFEFRFKLEDSDVECVTDLTEHKKVKVTVTAAQKIKLFKTLIELFGVGAKTNVGYGALTPVEDGDAKEQIKQAEGELRRGTASTPSASHIGSSQRREQTARPTRGNSDSHTCAVRGCANTTKRVLCQNCYDAAITNGRCALCGEETDWNKYRGEYFPLCRNCKQQHNPK